MKRKPLICEVTLTDGTQMKLRCPDEATCPSASCEPCEELWKNLTPEALVRVHLSKAEAAVRKAKHMAYNFERLLPLLPQA